MTKTTTFKKGSRKSDSRLLKTFKAVVYVGVYYFFGSLFYMKGPEKMSLKGSVYFITVTMTTIGYGDVTPTTDLGKIFTMVYIIVGLAVVFPWIVDIGDCIKTTSENYLMMVLDDDPDDNKSPLWVKGVLAVTMILVPLFVGFVYFATYSVENDACGWRKIDALWWTFATVTTVGFGDLTLCHPVTDHWFLTVFAIMSVTLVAAAVQTITSLNDEIKAQRLETQLLDTFDIETIKALDTNGDGVDQNEYVLGMLEAMGHISEDSVKKYVKQFELYDADGLGLLDAEDLDLIGAEMMKAAHNHHGHRAPIPIAPVHDVAAPTDVEAVADAVAVADADASSVVGERAAVAATAIAEDFKAKIRRKTTKKKRQRDEKKAPTAPCQWHCLSWGGGPGGP